MYFHQISLNIYTRMPFSIDRNDWKIASMKALDNTTQKMMFCIRNFFSKCDQICTCVFCYICWTSSKWKTFFVQCFIFDTQICLIYPKYWSKTFQYISVKKYKPLKRHIYKKRKDSLKTRAVFLTFSFELEIYGVYVQRIHQNSERWWLLWGIIQWKWLLGCFRATFCCYDYVANASEAVQKIATDPD